jgi:multidrug efflux pump subunit AcrA (membrane-fusion protein)
VDAAEIDLPVKSEDLAYLDLPEHYRGEAAPVLENAPEVILTAPYAGRTGTWKGQLVRVAGTIDKNSRQLYVTAIVQDPYARRSAENPPLKIGMWVSGLIRGSKLQNAFVVPRLAIREGDQLLLIDKEDRLRTRRVTIAWGAQDHVVVTGGLQAGELLCTVPLHYAVEGSKVKVTRQPMPKVNLPGTSGADLQTQSPVKEAGAPDSKGS